MCLFYFKTVISYNVLADKWHLDHVMLKFKPILISHLVNYVYNRLQN